MRALPLGFFGVTFLAGPHARADRIDASEVREAAMTYDFSPLRRDEVGFRWRAELVAAALASTQSDTRETGGAGTVSAEVGITAASDCDVVSAGGQLAARSDEHTLAAQQWGSVCLLGGDGHIALDHRLEWDVTPRLLAAPRLRPGQQRRETVGLDFYGSTRPLHDRGPLTLVPSREWIQAGELRLDVEVGWTPEPGQYEIHPTFDIVAFRTLRFDHDDGPPTTLGVLGMKLEVLDRPGDLDRTAADLGGDLAHLEGYRVGGFRLGARLGGRVGAISEGHEATYRQEAVTIGEGGVSAEHDLAGTTMRVDADRRAWPAWDARFVVDDRLKWSLLAAHGRWRGRLEAAAALTHLVEIGKRHIVGTGGLTAEAEVDLGHNFALKAHSEAGRSVYARDATLDEPRWASETLVMLATHAGRRAAEPRLVQ